MKQKRQPATCGEIVLTTALIMGACYWIMTSVSNGQRAASTAEPVVMDAGAQVADTPEPARATPTAESFNEQMVRDRLRTVAGEVVLVDLLESPGELFATVGYVPEHVDDAPLLLDEIGNIGILLADTPLDGVLVALGRDENNTLGVATILLVDVRAHLAGDMTRDQMQARIRFDNLTGSAPTREQVATIPTWVNTPANCATAVARGLTAEQAGQYALLDRDGDGVACYGE